MNKLVIMSQESVRILDSTFGILHLNLGEKRVKRGERTRENRAERERARNRERKNEKNEIL